MNETQDRAEAERFVRALTGDVNTPIDWATFPDSKGPSAPPAVRFRGTVAESWNRLVLANNSGAGVFCTINATDGKGFTADHVTAIRAAFVDDDTESVEFETLAQAGLPPSLTVQSSNGQHSYWIFPRPPAPPEDPTDFTPLQKELARKFRTDAKVHDLPRVLRVPGFLHLKNPTDPFLVYVVQENAAVYTVRQIVDAFGLMRASGEGAGLPVEDGPGKLPGRPFANIDGARKFAPTSERIRFARAYLAKVPGAVEGQGGDAATLKAANITVCDFDLDDESALEALDEFNSRCVPPWEEGDLLRKIENARKYARGNFGSKCAAEERRPATAERPLAAHRTAATGPEGDLSTPEDEIIEIDSSLASLARDVYTWIQTETEKLFELPGKIRLNYRSGQITIGENPFALDESIARFQRNLGKCLPAVFADEKGREKVRIVPDGLIRAQLISLAAANQFDPVSDYLAEREGKHDGIDRVPLLLSSLNLKVPTPLYETFLRKTLIGAVARALKPGCKLDTMTILHAEKGGEKKSSFFRALFGSFSDDCIQIDNKDSWMMINKFWALEWTELEAMKSAKSRESVKAFLSRQSDTYRPPYGRELETHPRRSIFIGTTNQRTILEDDGGNRRFWVIPDVGAIEVEKVFELRDQLWSQAIAEYRAGATWWLDREEDVRHEEAQKEHVHEEVGVEALAMYLSGVETISLSEIVTEGPEIFKTSLYQNKRGEAALSKMLSNLKWERFRDFVNGARPTRWRRTNEASPQSAKPGVFARVQQAPIKTN